MGGSSPPFLYDPPSTWSFDSHVGTSPNPKAVTQASWTPRQSMPRSDGPLLNVRRHPDTWGIPRQGKTITPMSSRTKVRVQRTRLLQLLLRIAALVAALGALFCVICVNGTGISMGWIIRVAPAVATLHTMYAIYHLCRAPADRPPASTASYMLFASSMDAGLIPFYAFTAFAANRQYVEDAYGWSTLFNDAQITNDVIHALFLLGAICSALHAVSFIISVYLAIVFRQIATLPPDMNPLEDNLTARPHKRNRSEISEKHRSQSTLGSTIANSQHAVDNPFMGEPRTIPFMHTRQGSSDTMVEQQRMLSNEKRTSQTSLQSHRPSRSDLPSQQRRLYEQSNRSSKSLTRSSARRIRDGSSRPSSMVLSDAPVLQPSASGYVPTDFRWGSPVSSLESDNWVTYPSPTSSPVNENIVRQPSPVSIQSDTPPSLYSWLGSAQKYDHDESNALPRKARGDYAALEDQEECENDENVNIIENAEQDLGERYEDHDRSANPLGMNPPTPQPKDEELEKSATRRTSLRRVALVDLPNPSVKSQEMPPTSSLDSKGFFYGELENNTGHSVPRAVSKQEMPLSRGEKPKIFGSKKLWRRKSGKSSAYESVKAKDDDDEGEDSDGLETPELTPKKRSTQAGTNQGDNDTDSDRKGRVVSNSGIDLGDGLQLGSGSNSYGSYISGLGVGRRRDHRDVSGKVAEEGRGSPALYNSDREEDTPDKKRNSTTTRAAGWARFAGL